MSVYFRSRSRVGKLTLPPHLIRQTFHPSSRERGVRKEYLLVSNELNVLELVTARLEGAGVLSGGGMNDISPDMEPRYRAMSMERSGEERLNVRCAKGMIRQAFWIGIRVHRPPRVWRIRATRRSGQIPARGKGRAGARGNPQAIR